MAQHNGMHGQRSLGIILSLILALPWLPAAVLAQTRVKPGMNLFSLKQDVEMGQEAAKEIEKQVRLLNDRVSNRYISDLGHKLAKNTQYPDLPWQFKVVNSAEVNAFALPGGFVYVNRGLIEAAETEGELAGVLGHEISHVTLRHGTNQLTKAYLAQAPLAILGGALGSGGWQAVVGKMGLGVVLNSMFLKFSRKAETQADIVGTQLMARSGYDPHQMTRMFELLRRMQGRDPSKMEEFFSNHPSPKNRIERINKEIAMLPPVRHPVITSRRFEHIRARLKKLPPPPKTRPRRAASHRQRRPDPPSRTFQRYRHPQGWYEMSYPSNWKAYRAESGSVTFAPEAGLQNIKGQSQVVYGAIVDVFTPQPRRSPSLAEATDELIAQLRRTNRYLKPVPRSRRRTRLGRARAIRVALEGSPPGQDYVERVWLVSRWMGNELLYIAFVAPKEAFPSYQSTFSGMMRRLRLSHSRGRR